MVARGHESKVPIVRAFRQSTRVPASLAYRLMVAIAHATHDNRLDLEEHVFGTRRTDDYKCKDNEWDNM